MQRLSVAFWSMLGIHTELQNQTVSFLRQYFLSNFVTISFTKTDVHTHTARAEVTRQLKEERKWTQDENYCIREQLNFEKEQGDLLNESFLKEFWLITALCWTDVFSLQSPTFISFLKPTLVCVHIVFHIEYNRTHYISLFAYVEQSRCWRQLCVWKSLFITREILKGVLPAVDRQELQSTMFLLYSIDPSVCIIEIGNRCLLPPAGDMWM